MPISFRPMRQLMAQKKISFYRLANEGIDAQTLQRIRHDKPITTETLGKLCDIMDCQPGDLIEFRKPTDSHDETQGAAEKKQEWGSPIWGAFYVLWRKMRSV